MVVTEYWLQKKTIGGWSHVTYYTDLEQAKRNYNSASAGDSGYSWRLASVEVVECKMLEDVVPVEAPPVVVEPIKSSWGNPPADKSGWGMQDKKSGWGATPTAVWGENIKIISPSPNAGPSVPDGRGAKPGSIYLMHHGLKKRCRAMPDELDMLLSQGWVRGGPRTQFEG